ncbi:MAG TPA: hypothetical protein VIK00_03885 [Candidatus Limnocylindrales bacterium]
MTQHEEIEPTPLARTSRARAWLLPALGVAIVLGGVVYLGRSAMDTTTPAQTLAPTHLPPPVVAFGPGPRASSPSPPDDHPQPTPGVLPGSGSVNSPGGPPPFGARSAGQRYIDGLPTSFDGSPVNRVAEALRMSVGSSAFVAGWYHSTECRQDEIVCPISTISDDPAGSPRGATMIVTGTQFWLGGTGPRILQGTITQPSTCTSDDNLACSVWLYVDSIQWAGDEQTAADPTSTIGALASLSRTFPDVDFRPFLEATSCPVTWPSQTYLASVANVPRAESTSLPVRLVMLFPSTADRIAGERQIRTAAESLSSFDAANRCVGLSEGVGPDSWLARKNALILLGDNDAATIRQVRTAIAAAV